jgi:hypothetical protein
VDVGGQEGAPGDCHRVRDGYRAEYERDQTGQKEPMVGRMGVQPVNKPEAAF